jgi:hypothetical protein
MESFFDFVEAIGEGDLQIGLDYRLRMTGDKMKVLEEIYGYIWEKRENILFALMKTGL